MDNIKTGALIRQLRKEKGLTQLQLAEHLHITDRAVSKWERGLCAPDIALLEPLAQILDVSILELIEGQRHESAERIPEIEETALAVIDYSGGEIARKVRKSNRKLMVLLAVILLILAGIGGYILWQSGLLFVIDRVSSPDGLYTLTVYSKKLEGDRFYAEDAISIIVQKKGEDLSYRFVYGDLQYQGVWWSPDGQKYVLSLRDDEGTRLITSTSSNLNALLAMGVDTTELRKYGYNAKGFSTNIDYQFLQWALDSQSMLIYYSFRDRSDSLHEGYFWYNCHTGQVNAILEMDLDTKEGP